MYEHETKAAINAAKKASEAVMEIYKSNHIDYLYKKIDNSPLTEADLKSSEIICNNLKNYFDYEILCEETCDNHSRISAEYVWIIDPLDGTKEFINRIEEFTINIALIKNRKPVVGVIANPVKKVYYFASANGGAYRVENDSQIQLHTVKKSTIKNLKIAVSRSHIGKDMEKIISQYENATVISQGSALKFCSLVDGVVDVVIRDAPLSEWDIAAADCIINEASGIITNFIGQTFSYNSKKTLIENGIIAADHSLHNLLLQQFIAVS